MKIAKVIFINIVVILIALCCVEVYFHKIIFDKYAKYMPEEVVSVGPLKFLKYHRAKITDFEEQKKEFRPTSYKNGNKGAVILFGCSYTYGTWLKDDETFSKKLSDYTGRTVYNRAFPTVAVPFMYYQFENNLVKKDIPSADFIVYTLTEEHLAKISTNRGWILAPELQITYELKNDKLQKKKILFPLIYSTYSSIAIQEKIKNEAWGKRKYELIIEKLLDKSFELAKKDYPNAQIVLFVFDDKNWGGVCTQEFLDYLKNADYKVVWLSDLLGYKLSDKDCYVQDNFHPSAKAWDIIVPKFADELQMK